MQTKLSCRFIEEDNMETLPGIKEIKRKTYWSYHQDGLIELCLGLVFFIFGIHLFIGDSLLAGICWMPGLLIAPLKRILTAPRIGTVRLGRTRVVMAAKLGLLALTFGLVLFIVVASLLDSPGLNAWTQRYFAVAFGFSLALFPLAVAISLGIRRYYGHAVLLAAGFSFIQYRPDSLAAVFTSIGSVLTLVGTVVLIRFLRNNPVIGKEGAA
jgi:hypothetical protein